MGWRRPMISGEQTSYSTSFAANEAPISESGAWQHNGTLWTTISTSSGNAFGTQTGDESGDPGYNDSYAYLQGFSANQRVDLTIHRDGVSITGNQEIECLLRWLDTTSTARGYECLLPRQGSSYGVQIVRWNGPLADFTYLLEVSGPASINDGDIFAAQIVGNVITVSYKPTATGIESTLGTVNITAGVGSDLVHTTGQPGIGMFRRNTSGTNTFPQSFCASAFAAVGL